MMSEMNGQSVYDKQEKDKKDLAKQKAKSGNVSRAMNSMLETRENTSSPFKNVNKLKIPKYKVPSVAADPFLSPVMLVDKTIQMSIQKSSFG